MVRNTIGRLQDVITRFQVYLQYERKFRPYQQQL